MIAVAEGADAIKEVAMQFTQIYSSFGFRTKFSAKNKG
jgi:hypothetical protein